IPAHAVKFKRCVVLGIDVPVDLGQENGLFSGARNLAQHAGKSIQIVLVQTQSIGGAEPKVLLQRCQVCGRGRVGRVRIKESCWVPYRCNTWEIVTVPVVCNKEEQLVLDDRAADRTTCDFSPVCGFEVL